MVSIVVPTYNSEKCLAGFFDEVHELFSKEGIAHEFIFVDDCSNDSSWQIITALHTAQPGTVKGIHLLSNSGQHMALYQGFIHATGEVVLTSDVDLHIPKQKLVELYRQLTVSNTDFTYLSYSRHYPNFALNIMSNAFNMLYHAILSVSDYGSNYRAMKKGVFNRIVEYEFDYGFIDTFLFLNAQGLAVSSSYLPGPFKNSGYTYNKKIRQAVWVLYMALIRKFRGFKPINPNNSPSLVAAQLL